MQARQQKRTLTDDIVAAYPNLPSGVWVSPEAARQWDALLEHWETIGATYRQGLTLSLVNLRMSRRFANPAYRARIEREHKRKSTALEARMRDYFQRHYVPDVADALDFDLLWLPRD